MVVARVRAGARQLALLLLQLLLLGPALLLRVVHRVLLLLRVVRRVRRERRVALAPHRVEHLAVKPAGSGDGAMQQGDTLGVSAPREQRRVRAAAGNSSLSGEGGETTAGATLLAGARVLLTVGALTPRSRNQDAGTLRAPPQPCGTLQGLGPTYCTAHHAALLQIQ